jgi:hypothetical protein
MLTVIKELRTARNPETVNADRRMELASRTVFFANLRSATAMMSLA